MQEINKQRRSAQSRQSGRDLIRQSKKGVVIGRSPFIKAPPKIIVRHTRFPRPRDVGNRIKAVQIRVVLERKPVIQNPFQDSISKLYVLQNYKTKTVSARGEIPPPGGRRRKVYGISLLVKSYAHSYTSLLLLNDTDEIQVLLLLKKDADSYIHSLCINKIRFD